MTNRREFFHGLLERVKSEPHFPAREVVTSQLDYLLSVLDGRASRDQLSKISLGLFAVRNLDGWDNSDLPDLLFKAQSEAEGMQKEDI